MATKTKTPPEATHAHELMQSVEAGLIGLDQLVERLMIALLVGGHVLIEGAPGLAKTRAVTRLAEGLEGSFGRIQSTPDLLPSDLTGTQVFRLEQGKMEFLKGPIFHDFVLVDEINRAPPKVQSALLEAMAERQVTSGGHSYVLPESFIVVATQNPLEQEGTFPLPEAQLDRFLFQVNVDFPDAARELEILNLVEGEIEGDAKPVSVHLTHKDLFTMRRDVTKVHLSPAVRFYIVELIQATRDHERYALTASQIEYPVSPRGTLSLAAASRARAFLLGREFVIPEDVQALASDVLAHRLRPTWQARSAGINARDIVAEILSIVPTP